MLLKHVAFMLLLNGNKMLTSEFRLKLYISNTEKNVPYISNCSFLLVHCQNLISVLVFLFGFFFVFAYKSVIYSTLQLNYSSNFNVLSVHTKSLFKLIF